MKTHYSIKDLEAISGIQAHTIRIWEQRYTMFSPNRTPSNIRYYSDADVQKLLNVGTLQRYGWKISKIGTLTTEEINLELKKQISKNTNQENFILDAMNEMVYSLLKMDEPSFHSVFDLTIQKIGFVKTIEQIIFPILVKVGIMWNTNEIIPAQEHFISSLIKMKIAAATNQIVAQSDEIEKIILFTPENEMHDISLLLVNYILKTKGYTTVYLGQSVPIDNIESVCQIAKADTVFFTVTIANNSEKLITYLNKLAELHSLKNIFFMAPTQTLTHKTLPTKVRLIGNPALLEHFFPILKSN